jgi:hypothetical protein
MWTYLRHARTFVENHLPFWEMSPAPALVTGETPAFGGAEDFFKANDTYAVNLPASDATGTLDLSGTTGTFQKRWYDPRNGVFVGGASAVSGGRPHALGAPPAGTSADDWVVLFARGARRTTRTRGALAGVGRVAVSREKPRL